MCLTHQEQACILISTQRVFWNNRNTNVCSCWDRIFVVGGPSYIYSASNAPKKLNSMRANEMARNLRLIKSWLSRIRRVSEIELSPSLFLIGYRPDKSWPPVNPIGWPQTLASKFLFVENYLSILEQGRVIVIFWTPILYLSSFSRGYSIAESFRLKTLSRDGNRVAISFYYNYSFHFSDSTYRYGFWKITKQKILLFVEFQPCDQKSLVVRVFG